MCMLLHSDASGAVIFSTIYHFLSQTPVPDIVLLSPVRVNSVHKYSYPSTSVVLYNMCKASRPRLLPVSFGLDVTGLGLGLVFGRRPA